MSFLLFFALPFNTVDDHFQNERTENLRSGGGGGEGAEDDDDDEAIVPFHPSHVPSPGSSAAIMYSYMPLLN